MEINGIAHIQLTVTKFEEAKAFYRSLCEFFGMKLVIEGEDVFYYVGCRTGLAITRCSAEFRHETFQQRRVGLHHLCFRARERADVDQVYRFLQDRGVVIVHPPEEGPWAPGYYSVLFEDPDGIRLEVNYVPGKGNFDPNIKLPLPVPDVP